MNRFTDNSSSAEDSGVTGLGDLASQAFNKQLRLLQISDLLSRKTDLELLLECFFTESQNLVAFEGLGFSIPDSHEQIMLGRKRQSCLSLNLANGGRDLGVLTIYTAASPESRDERELEGLVPGLLYPLATALDNRQAKFASWLDDLTGMNNQLALNEMLPREMLLAREAEESLSLLMIDLDYFRKTIDSHGEEVAEQILVAVADSLAANLRSTDVIFRYENDRFVVILGMTDFDDATLVSERLRTCVERCFAYENVQLVQNASAGVTEMVDSDTVSSLLARSESALVNAKRGGRNQVRFLAAAQSS